MTSTRLKLELIVDIDLDGTAVSDIIENMNYVATHAMMMGLITTETSATVDNYTSKVDVIE